VATGADFGSEFWSFSTSVALSEVCPIGLIGLADDGLVVQGMAFLL
jgi:hypothetical protein